MNLLHIVESLNVGGTTRVVENLALLAMHRGIHSTVLGFRGSADYASHLQAHGIDARLIETQSDRLRYLRSAVPPDTHTLIHRSGEHCGIWDELINALPLNERNRLIEINIFGYLDKGPSAKRIRKFCFNSKHTLWRAWRAAGTPPISEFLEKHRVLYNPVTIDPSPEDVLERRNAIRKSLGLPLGAFVIGDLCRPAPEKLDAMLLAVSPILLRRIPNLWVVTRSFPNAMARGLSHRLGDRYINLPVSDDSQIALDTLCAMDVLVHMSTMGESFGMANAEAMRCGIPVICNETPRRGCNNAQCELIRDGISGYLANDPQMVIQHICTLASSPALIRNLGEAARQYFRSSALSPDHIVSDLLNELSEASGDERITQAPGKDELNNYLRSYDEKFLVEPNTLRNVTPSLFLAALQRLLWRLRRRFWSK